MAETFSRGGHRIGSVSFIHEFVHSHSYSHSHSQVAHTDLYRVTPHADLLGPKSVLDIEMYMNAINKRRKKTKIDPKPALIHYDSPSSAIFAYLRAQFEDGVSMEMVQQCLQKHKNNLSNCLIELQTKVSNSGVKKKSKRRCYYDYGYIYI